MNGMFGKTHMLFMLNYMRNDIIINIPTLLSAQPVNVEWTWYTDTSLHNDIFRYTTHFVSCFFYFMNKNYFM